MAGWADPRLAAAAAAARAAGVFEDDEFVCQSKTKRGKLETVLEVLYISGVPPAHAKAKKVDGWARLEQMGSADEKLTDRSLLVFRDGGINDSWLLSALGMVQSKPELLAKVHHVPEGTSGLHAFHIFKNGDWETVIVDDLVPCIGKLKPAYGSNSDPTAGIAVILEKALAKLYGAYEHLNNGRVGGALEDLTGGVSDKLYLRDGITTPAGAPKQSIDAAAEIASGAMYARLEALLRQGHLLGACYKSKYRRLGTSDEGPAIAEAIDEATVVWPIVEFKQVHDQGFVRLRSIWAKVGEVRPEWKGAWSGTSVEWQNNLPVATALGGKPKDGTFWMTFTDFCAGFNKVYICRLFSGWGVTRHHGEWDLGSAGGYISPAPTSQWRSNPQYRLTVHRRCSLVLALSQPDAQTDANEASDAYPHAIGLYLLAGHEQNGRRRLISSEVIQGSRFACSRQVCLTVDVNPSSSTQNYTILPCTYDSNIFLKFCLTVASATDDATVELIDRQADWRHTRFVGAWSVISGTAGGCPNFPESWTQNPQVRLSANMPGAVAVGVLRVTHELAAHQQRQEGLIARMQQCLSEGDERQAAELQQAADALSIGFMVVGMVGADGDALSGPVELLDDDLVCRPEFAPLASEQVSASIVFPDVGRYTLVASTFVPQTEASFQLDLYTEPGAVDVTPLQGARSIIIPGVTEPSAMANGQKTSAPMAKHDVSRLRAETEDDGAMGYAQRMELEEELRLAKWVENVPMMTIEGQPLTENVKRKKDELVARALAYCQRTGRKFEDSGTGGFPEASGNASGELQPQVYNGGGPALGMPTVVDWRRPEEIFEHVTPRMFANDWSAAEGIVGSWEAPDNNDNRWLISALNIVAANRTQLDRVFFGELDQKWIDHGFFVCKFYRDDPYSDDDWQVVLVDDRIPCDASGMPAFARNHEEGIYWASIVEKAYAKFCGTYQAMQGGTVTQGLEDLTGGIGYKFDLQKKQKDWIPPKGATPDRLWDEIMEKLRTEHVIGCSVNTKGQERPQTTRKGILLNRAYAMVTGGEFEDYRLMRLRIPLDPTDGALEWNGKWSDKSSAWSNRLRQMLNFSGDSDDGTFWMEYPDFCRHFNKVYMCRMLDDLWTRFTVKSRWMDETAGGCTNFISWRNNNQWLLNIQRPQTKLIIKLTQPDARKDVGHGRHYTNAIGFYILKGNAPNAANDHKRRKLILQDGNVDDDSPGDFVFQKEPRFSRQVVVEYTFEEASETPFILLPYIFEPGREALFKMTILSDDRDDDGEPDFGFQEVKPAEDWKRTLLHDAWSKGGEGNPLGIECCAGGSLNGGTWASNPQFQITLHQTSRCFLFLELLEVKTDMRTMEGLQTSPHYPTIGFTVFRGRGNHVLLEQNEHPEILFASQMKASDGVCLELGAVNPLENKIVVIPYTDTPDVEHKFALTLYTDYEHIFEKINPTLVQTPCVHCNNPVYMPRILEKLAILESKMRMLQAREQQVKSARLLGVRLAPPSKMPSQPDLRTQAQLAEETGEDNDSFITAAELSEYTNRVHQQASAQHAQYVAAITAANDENSALEAQIAQVKQAMRAAMSQLTPSQQATLSAKWGRTRGSAPSVIMEVTAD